MTLVVENSSLIDLDVNQGAVLSVPSPDNLIMQLDSKEVLGFTDNSPGFQKLVHKDAGYPLPRGRVLKEHRGAVSCIKTNKNDKEGVTASLDGTCVIWDLERYVRKQMILDNTLFKCVCYHRGEYQIITSGTDRKIVYWEVLDGSAIREVQGSLSSSINGMDITSDGASFVTGGDDHLVELWDYKEGTVTHVGVGHSGNITRLKICPANKYMVSVSADGAVLIWKQPSSG
ncbi:cilia- and flagella-associated protein 52-like [Columba livia]|uniref:cilia- and flagella-associated protein 52-like n=1 Tax=Columba livia TaxID=8932 RepID=UPI0031BB259D